MVLTALKTSSQIFDSNKTAQKNESAHTPTIRPVGVPPSEVDYEYTPSTYYEHLDGKFGWFARGDFEPLEDRVPFNRPKLRQIYGFLPFVFRYSAYWIKHIRNREKLFINTFEPLKHKPFYGVPCGGIGCGSIGRDFRGGFCKFSLRPGLVEHKVDAIKANQFILSLSRNGQTVHQVCLTAVPFAGAGVGGTTTVGKQNPSSSTCSAANSNDGLATKMAADGNNNSSVRAKGSCCGAELFYWNFHMPASKVTYRGLYPRSWTRFELDEHQVAVTCRQVSPVIPRNYKDSSLPVTVFAFTIENCSDEPLEASITFTFRDGTGATQRRHRCGSAAIHSDTFQTGNHVQGATLDQTLNGMPCTYAIGASTSEPSGDGALSVCRSFDPIGSGRNLWQMLYSTGGRLEEVADHDPKDAVGVAVCQRARVAPHASTADGDEMAFALAWHMPVVHFGGKKRCMRRWYSKWFGVERRGAVELCDYALRNYRHWEAQIDAWQRPILNHPNLPDWFKSALFNELYFLSDGGSMWFDFDEQWRTDESQMSDYAAALFRRYGRFGYLESWEYRMVNTYDVHFYASSALAELFPDLEHSVQADISDQVAHSDNASIKYHMEGDVAPRKTFKRVPHDVGNPADDPWLLTNAYIMHDTGKWKDLNLKFVLTSYRDYRTVLGGDRCFLEFVWPSVKDLMDEAIKHWDTDGDGMIENFGVADQTYDAWRMVGVSAYCGSLWLAALRAAAEMASEIGDDASRCRFVEMLAAARQVYERKLWNGRYYNFDEGSVCRVTIMADQLCGYWFLQSANPTMAKDLLPDDHVRSALDTIYAFNVRKFGGGRTGAVNGMYPTGKIDTSHIQADEMWTGVTYALASFYIQQGDVQRGFDVAWGCYDTCYNRSGLQYQTPEAVYQKRFYRAIGYMRPLAVWAMYGALCRGHGLLDGNASAALRAVRTGNPMVGCQRVVYGADVKKDCNGNGVLQEEIIAKDDATKRKSAAGVEEEEEVAVPTSMVVPVAIDVDDGDDPSSPSLVVDYYDENLSNDETNARPEIEEKNVGHKEVEADHPVIATTPTISADNDDRTALNGASAGGIVAGRRHRRRKIELIVVKTTGDGGGETEFETKGGRKGVDEADEEGDDGGFCHVLEESIVSIMRAVAATEDGCYNGGESGGLEALIAENMLCKVNDVSRGDSELLRDSGLDSMTNKDESVVNGIDSNANATVTAAKKKDTNDDRGQ